MNIDSQQMLESSEEATQLLKALANPTRLMIVCQLIDGERSVGDIATGLGIRDSTASQHLALLRKDGILSTRRDGQTVYYDIKSDAAKLLLNTLYDIYCAPRSAEKTPSRKSKKGG